MIDDEKIIDLFFERSEQGIQELDNKYGVICHTLSYNIVNNRQDAEECVNEAYLGAWNTIPPVRPNPLLSYNALEEAVVNAVFHKSYQEPEPVEIRIYVDSIVIINYPGLARWVKLDKFIQGKERARKYRNRRIGEMFKELELSEKQGTGITKILRELDKNGSPKPEFEMDDDRHYLETTIHIRDGLEPEQLIKPPADENEGSLKEVLKEADFKKVASIIEAIDKTGRVSPAEAKRLCGKSESTTWRYLKLLKSTGYVEPVGNTNNVIYNVKSTSIRRNSRPCLQN